MVQYKILGPGIQPASQTPVETELRILNTTEILTLPVVTSTKVIELKEYLSQRLGIDPCDIQFVHRVGCTWRKQLDHEEVGRKVTVGGIRSFKPEKASYKDPFLIIGAGHIGLRHGLYLLQRNFKDFVIVDRRNKVGGTSWISQANKTSKLQTELGTYHLQYDEINDVPKDMSTWPTRDELLEHFAKVSNEYGLMPYIKLCTNVKQIEITGKTSYDGPLGKAHLEMTSESYTGVDTPEPTGKGVESFNVSCAFMYPGNLSLPRQFVYQGEETFQGVIEYAMFDNVDYDKVARGKTVMIAGHGAFGVENIRTCCEFSTKKIYLVCRRKNLACPRVCSWLANQSNPPISGALFMESLMPAYQLIGFDPWVYHSVSTNAQRSSAHINQKSRFGIGDVYFLALSMGKCEVIEDDVKRLSSRHVHLESGRDLEVDTILKVFGFTGLYEVDRLLKIKNMTGWWAEGDNRRHIASENPGVYAGNFASTSLSPGAYGWSQTATHMMWFPKDWRRLVESGQLPQNAADDTISRPAYVLDAKTGLTMQFTIPSICPSLGEMQMNNGNVKRQKQLQCHPLQKFLEECATEWDWYGKTWKAEDPGLKDPPAYPYTLRVVEEYLRRSEQ